MFQMISNSTLRMHPLQLTVSVSECNRSKYFLQSVLNSAARSILVLNRFDHITPARMDLHWLPCPQATAHYIQTLYDYIYISACVVLPLLILLTIALVLVWCLVDQLWDLLLIVAWLFLVIGLGFEIFRGGWPQQLECFACWFGIFFF